MYCPTCECEFEGWTGRCPNCKNPLQEERPPDLRSGEQQIDYESLVDTVNKQGGSLIIKLKACEVSKTKATRFPWLGYGYAWTKRMQGSKDGIMVDLSTSKVGKDRKWRFPYQGFGYAWRQEMQGSISGIKVTLTAKKVTRKKSWSFPYSGYGYSWTEEMSGECGQNLSVELKTSEVTKVRRWLFPYFGFGYAWVKVGELSLTLV